MNEEKKPESPAASSSPISLFLVPALNIFPSIAIGVEPESPKPKRAKQKHKEYSNEQRRQMFEMFQLQDMDVETINQVLKVNVSANYLYQLNHQFKERQTTDKKPKKAEIRTR